MQSPYEVKNAIYKRLGEIEKIINPTNDKFMFDHTHYLCPERDGLIKTFYEYMAYERWFSMRHPGILVSISITGTTAIQNRINTAVAYNFCR